MALRRENILQHHDFLPHGLLASFPPEVSTQVVRYLDRSSALALSKSCRMHYDLALPFVWLEITLYDCRYYRDSFRPNISIPFLYSLASVLFKKEDARRSYVRIFKVKHAQSPMTFPQTSYDDITASNMSPEVHNHLLLAGPSCKKLKRFKEWVAGEPDHEFLLTRLLPTIPNLEQLRYPFAKYLAPLYRQPINRKNFLPEGQAAYQCLRILSCPATPVNRNSFNRDAADSDEGMSEAILATFMELPSLKTLEGYVPKVPCATEWRGFAENARSNITHITLDIIGRTPMHLTALMTACRNLQSLRLTWILLHLEDEPDRRSLASLYGSLTIVASTVHTLTLAYKGMRLPDAQPNEDLRLDLSPFTRLTDIDIGMTFCLGFRQAINYWSGIAQLMGDTVSQDLPPAVQSLYLRVGTLDSLRLLLANVNSILTSCHQYPRLKSIAIEVCGDGDEEDAFAFRDFSEQLRVHKSASILSKLAREKDIKLLFVGDWHIG